MAETAGVQLLFLDYLGKKVPTFDKSMTLPEFTRPLRSSQAKRVTALLHIYIYVSL